LEHYKKIINILQNITRVLSSNWLYWCKKLPVYLGFVFIGSSSSGYENLFYGFFHGKSLGNTAQLLTSVPQRKASDSGSAKTKLQNLNSYKQGTKNDTEIHTHTQHTVFSPAVIRISRLPQEHYLTSALHKVFRSPLSFPTSRRGTLI